MTNYPVGHRSKPVLNPDFQVAFDGEPGPFRRLVPPLKILGLHGPRAAHPFNRGGLQPEQAQNI
jgi:hypothetical protein